MNRRWLVVLGVGLVVAAGWLWYLQAQGKADPKLDPLPAPTPEERQADAIRVQVEGHDLTVEQLRATEAGWALFATGKAASTELEGLHKQVGDVFKGLDRLPGARFADIGILLRTDELKDVYGNTLKDLPVLEIGLSRATFETINWDGFDPQNFPRVADRYWVHEEIQRLALEKQEQQSAGGGEGGEGDAGGS